MPIIIEVALESLADTRAAEAGGADRIELCSSLELDGLTPTLGSYQIIQQTTSLPICVMIRPRPGDFVYSQSEVDGMCRDIELFRQRPPAGFVFGALDTNRNVDETTCQKLLRSCGPVPAIFHRAFDVTSHPSEALETLIHLGFRRVLTSGQAPTALEGIATIKEYVHQAHGRIEILPGGKIRSNSAARIIAETGCTQVHGSFADHSRQVSQQEIRKTRMALENLASG